MMTRNERGATAILVAACLLLLMGIAAIAIDLGAGFNERRQDQTASDLAAVAGALSFNDPDQVVLEVLDYAADNLPTAYTTAEWESLWEGCTDPDRPAGFLPLEKPASLGWGAGTLDCISMSPSFLRVRVPDQNVDTSFGRVLGTALLTTHADTVVTIYPVNGRGALPFAVKGLMPAGQICLDTGPGGLSEPPCDGPEAGSFGNIAPPLFGNTFIGTSPDCDQQTSSNNYVPESIAMGIDHTILTFSSSDWAATGWSRTDSPSNNTVEGSSVNMDLCDDNVTDGHAIPLDGVPVNGVVVDTGNSVKAQVTEGLLSEATFVDGEQGRLWRTDNPVNVRSGTDVWQLDNSPLWEFLLPVGSQGGLYKVSSCDPTIWDSLTATEDKVTQMETCISDYETAAATQLVGQIFSDDILDSPRFGVAPQLWHDNLGSGVSYRPVEQFRLVYLNGLWFKKGSDVAVFYPDEDQTEFCMPQGTGCETLTEVEQMSAFLLLDEMFSPEVQGWYPGLEEGPNPTIYE